MATRTKGTGIPRLQELPFLEIAAKGVAKGDTFDQVRRGLIEYMASERSIGVSSGNHAIFRLARHDPHRYLTNAVEALAELMRLGLVGKAALPSTKAAAAAYRDTRFTLTAKGSSWISMLEQRRAAYDALLVELWRCHPQFAEYVRLLSRGVFIIPTANWTDVAPVAAGKEGRHEYIAFLAGRAGRAVEAGVTGWTATESEISTAIKDYLGERIEAATRRHRPDPYPRHRDFVGACAEALVSFAFHQAGLRLDYISHEIIRRWTKTLAIANFSYHVPGRPALCLWSTADLTEEGGEPKLRRRTVAEWGDRILDLLPEAYERARRQEPGNSWVPIYRVRADACSRLGLNDAVFNRALIEFLNRERRPDAPFRLNLDPSEYGNIPPSELPLNLTDKTGRVQAYRVMTLRPLS